VAEDIVSQELEVAVAELERQRDALVRRALAGSGHLDEYDRLAEAIAVLRRPGEVLASMPKVPTTAKPKRTRRASSPRPPRNGSGGAQSGARNRAAAIEFLRDHPGSAAIDVVRGADIKRGTVTGVLKRLVEEGVAEARDVEGRTLYMLAEPATASA
jgi:DNA-binding transcriptional ArsR family regulator